MQRAWAVALWGAAALTGCQADSPRQEAAGVQKDELPTIRAAVTTVRLESWPTIVRSQGNLVADEVTTVGAKVAGRVDEVLVDLGDEVKENQTLARLEQQEFQLQVALAEAQLAQARSALGLKPEDPLEQLEPKNAPPVREAKAVWDEAKANVARLEVLQRRDAVSKEQLEQAVSAEKVAEARYSAALNGVHEKIAQIRVRSAELSLAKQQLADSIVTSPFDGYVEQRHVDRGAFVQVGQPLVTLVRTSTLRFRGSIPERYARRLAVGQRVIVHVESVADPIEAQVTRISPVVQDRDRSLRFEAAVDNRAGQLRTGLFAEAEVIIDPSACALVVPASALTEFAGAEKVWKVVDGVAREQLVQSGRRGQAGIEILAGLAEGDVILQEAQVGRVARVETVTSGAPQPAHPVTHQPAEAESPAESASEPDATTAPSASSE